MIALAKVNRTLLESYYQNKGEVYDDTKTESALEVLADSIDTNDTEMTDGLALKTDKAGNHEGTWQNLSPADFDNGQQALDLRSIEILSLWGGR